jgi:hypothetical protein
MPVLTPAYRLHKSSGQAVVTIDGRDHDLGKHGSPESEDASRRMLAEFLVQGRAGTPGRSVGGTGSTVSDEILAYRRNAESCYRRGDGSPSPELDNLKIALKPLRKLYRETAAEFGPVVLKVVRQGMVDAGL